MKNIIRKILKESFDDDLKWIVDTEPPNDVMTFFIQGRKYEMDVLHKNNPSGYLTFDSYEPNGYSHTYDDGRGLLKFHDDGWGRDSTYSPLFIETRLKDLGLSLYDLEVKK